MAHAGGGCYGGQGGCDGSPLPSSPFMGRSLGYAHAGGDAQRGEDGGEDGDGRLDDVFPSFFVHGGVILNFEISYFEFSR